MKFDLHIGAPVHCKDKHYGKLAKVVVNPETQTVSDLIVRRGLIRREERVVPVSAVAKATPTEIELDLYSDEVSNYPVYRETEVKLPSYSRQMASASGGLGPQYGPTTYESTTTVTRTRLRDGVAAGKEIIGRSTGVENKADSLGHVDHVVIDTKSGEITEIIMRKGTIPSYYVISTESINEIHEKYVLVSFSKEDLSTLPHYAPRPDDEIQHDLCESLLTERTPAFRRVEPTVSNGSVRLAGFVPSAPVKRHAEELAYLIPGVIDVQNDLVVGDGGVGNGTGNAAGHVDKTETITHRLQNNGDLCTRLSTALATDSRTKNTVFEVIEDRGIVTLQGEAGDAKTRAAAEEIAAGQPGVASVVNEIRIRTAA